MSNKRGNRGNKKSRANPGEKMLFILNQIEESVEDISDIFFAFLNAGYGASSRKVDYEREKLMDKRIDRQRQTEARKRFNALLHHLVRQDLVNKKEPGFLKITTRGKKRRLELEKRKKFKSLPFADYDIEKHSKLVIVSFDIKETERHKRDWLRIALRNLGFKMVQHSLFVGKIKVPEEFLEDLRDLNLTNNVVIFEVSKSGSLGKIKL